MAMMVCDRESFKELIRERRRAGVDRFDEVWDGVYVMSPSADVDHQFVTFKLGAAFDQALDGLPDVKIVPGVNVSDRVEKWSRNFRCPDLAVYLSGNPAQMRGAYYLGGPDFAVEVVSPHDRSRKKLDFYHKVGTKELLIVDRKPWSLELYRADDTALILAAKVTADRPEFLVSSVLPLSFRLLPGQDRPIIEITQSRDGRRWLV